VARMRQRLRARALLLGHAGGTLAVIAEGRAFTAVRVTGLRHSFVLPAGTRELQLLRGSDVALGGLLVNGRPVGLDSASFVAGFHPVEQHRGRCWRRFDALARVAVPAPAPGGPVVLETLLRRVAPGTAEALSRVA